MFDEPFTRLALRVDQAGAIVDTVRIGFEERGVRLGTSLPIRIQSNVFSTTTFFGLSGEFRQLRQIDRRSNAITDFSNRWTLRPNATIQYRVQTNARDLMPNTGLVLSGVGEYDVAADRNPERGAIGQATLYIPLLKSINHGLRLRASVLKQNRGGIFNLDQFVPRGYDDRLFLGEGTFVKAGFQYRVPLWYLDNGFFFLPITVHAVYAYGFSEVLFPTSEWRNRRSSSGAGLGVQFRFASILNFDLRIGAAWLHEDRRWEAIFR